MGWGESDRGTRKPLLVPPLAHLQKAVLAAQELALAHDGLGGQRQLVLAECRFIPAWKHCLDGQEEQM